MQGKNGWTVLLGLCFRLAREQALLLFASRLVIGGITIPPSAWQFCCCVLGSERRGDYSKGKYLTIWQHNHPQTIEYQKVVDELKPWIYVLIMNEYSEEYILNPLLCSRIVATLRKSSVIIMDVSQRQGNTIPYHNIPSLHSDVLWNHRWHPENADEFQLHCLVSAEIANKYRD